MHFYAKTYVAKAKRGPKRRTTKTIDKMAPLSKRMGNAIRLDLIDGITTFKKKIPVELISEAWGKGDYAQVMAHIPWAVLPTDLAATLQGIATATAKAASLQIEALPPNINEHLRFDVSNPTIRNFLNSHSASLVTNIQADTQKVIQDAVARSFNEALTPRQVAEQIKGSIGLLPAHERALAKYREGLVAEKFAPARVEELAGAYEERLLDYRATTIARTETRAAITTGQLSVWREGANQGFFSRSSARKEWITAGDPCPACDPMDGVQVGLDDVWIVTYQNGETRAVQTPNESHPQCLCNMELHFGEDDEGKQNDNAQNDFTEG